VAIGDSALFNQNSGLGFNTAVGSKAMYSNTSGRYNTAEGYHALYNNTSGEFNTAIGYQALYFTTTQDHNTGIGFGAGVISSSISNGTALGANAMSDASNRVRIGNSSVTSIGGQVAWSNFSDGRFKQSIEENVKGIDFIKRLRPVTYTVDLIGLSKYYKSDLATEEIPIATERQSGFIAQEVEHLVKEMGLDFSGVDKPKEANALYGLRYSEFVVPLVKAVQEQQVMIEDMKRIILELKKEIEAMRK
jgi:hypothetical protein